MSSRQIRKLQQQRELEALKLKQQLEEEQVDDESEEDDFVPQAKPSAFSAFAALQDEDEDEDTDEEKGDVEEDRSAPSGLVRPVATPPKSVAKSKKKNKKAKAKANAQNKAQRKEDHKDGEEDIDSILRELSLQNKNEGDTGERDAQDSQTAESYERMCSLLAVSSYHLKVANEMKTLFGKDISTAHTGADSQGRRGRGQRMPQQVDLETALKGRHAPGKGLAEITLRRNFFIQGRDDWPKATAGGLTMEKATDIGPDGPGCSSEYRFVHDQAYEGVQQQFRMFVEMGDPNNLIGLLMRNPYHISTLLQVSKIAKQQGDHSLSNDLVERALFTFARCSLTQFTTKLSEGKARMNFARPENRELWLAGYHYIKSLIMKGTYRTALEWAKLLYALHPNRDVYGMRFMIPVLAIKAHEFQWLIDFHAYFSAEEPEPQSDLNESLVALAHLALRDRSQAKTVLVKHIESCPWGFGKLFQELNLEPLPPSIWGVQPNTELEHLMTELFIRQTKDLWNSTDAQGLLLEAAQAAPKASLDNVSTTYTTIPHETCRFVYLEGEPALLSLLPKAILHSQPNSDSDPLPPPYTSNIFSHPSQSLPWQTSSSPSSTFGNHFDPIAALRRLIPGWTGEGGEADERAIEATGLREVMARELGEAEQRELEGLGEEIEEAEREGEGATALPALRMLYEYLFGPRQAQERAEGGEGENNGNSEEESDGDEQHFHSASEGEEDRGDAGATPALGRLE
jgi:hypothetical protein